MRNAFMVTEVDIWLSSKSMSHLLTEVGTIVCRHHCRVAKQRKAIRAPGARGAGHPAIASVSQLQPEQQQLLSQKPHSS